jgi:hypothetical protein
MLRGERTDGAQTIYVVCRRDTGERHRIAQFFVADLHQPVTYVPHVAVRGRFAYAVIGRYDGTRRYSRLARMDTRTWRSVTHSLRLGDQGENDDSEVTDLVAAPGGRAFLRVSNRFAAGIVRDTPSDGAYIDEGLERNIGSPQLRGPTVTWRHGAASRSAPVVEADRCPPAPAPPSAQSPSAPGRGVTFASAEAVTSERWFCVRATGAIATLDGVVVRLLGPLAVVQRPYDVRVVDLRSQATVNGPAPCWEGACFATVGVSGTLVLRRIMGDRAATQLVALGAGMPERVVRTADITAMRYEDGVLRYETYPYEPDAANVDQPLP